MPAKNHLSKEQKERLLKTLKEHENPYVREKVLILLLMNDGKTYQEISNFLKIAYPTVAYWAVHGDPDNLESFLDGRKEGNFRKATKEYEDLLLELIEKEPAEYGYEFGRWTAIRLATYLEKETGIKLSGSQVRRILEKKKYVYLWAKYSLEDKQNPEKRKAFKEKLSEYLRITKATPERLQVWFWDESGFSLRVIRRKDILEKIEAEMPNMLLEFLPPYSPDYNLIELVWHSAKEYIAHRLFYSVEQLEELLNKLLNEGGLIIKWERKVKNKGSAIYSI